MDTEISLLMAKGRVGKVESYCVEINGAARGNAPWVLMRTANQSFPLRFPGKDVSSVELLRRTLKLGAWVSAS